MGKRTLNPDAISPNHLIKRSSGRRVEDVKYDAAMGPHLTEPLRAIDTKGLLQRLIWERAKGELNGVIAICRTEPVTPHCHEIEIKAMDLIMGLEAIIYKWKKGGR